MKDRSARYSVFRREKSEPTTRTVSSKCVSSLPPPLLSLIPFAPCVFSLRPLSPVRKITSTCNSASATCVTRRCPDTGKGIPGHWSRRRLSDVLSFVGVCRRGMLYAPRRLNPRGCPCLRLPFFAVRYLELESKRREEGERGRRERGEDRRRCLSFSSSPSPVVLRAIVFSLPRTSVLRLSRVRATSKPPKTPSQ